MKWKRCHTCGHAFMVRKNNNKQTEYQTWWWSCQICTHRSAKETCISNFEKALMTKWRIAMGKERHKSNREDPVYFMFNLYRSWDQNVLSDCYHEALRRFMRRINRKWVQSLQSQE